MVTVTGGHLKNNNKMPAYLVLQPIEGAAEYYADLYYGKPVVWMKSTDGYESVVDSAKTIVAARKKANKLQQKENAAVSKSNAPSRPKTKISDLLDVIHFTIIKENGENDVVLNELKSIDEKIQSGALVNYEVDDTAFFKHIMASYKP